VVGAFCWVRRLITAAAIVYVRAGSSEVTPFEVYSSLVGRWSGGRGRRERSCATLPRLKRIVPAPGLVAVLRGVGGSTVFHAGTPWWATTSQLAAARLAVPARHWPRVLVLGLIGWWRPATG